jgi:hypothetical protein
VFIDGAYIRAAPGYPTRHFEILMGRVEGAGRKPRHFAASPHVATGKREIARAALKAQGWMPGHAVTGFSDGDQSLCGTVMSAMRDCVTNVLDWFHLSMRLHHIEQVWQAIEDLKDELRSASRLTLMVSRDCATCSGTDTFGKARLRWVMCSTTLQACSICTPRRSTQSSNGLSSLLRNF